LSYRDDHKALVEVRPDLEFQKKLLEAEIAFWDLVKTDTPPPLTERDAKVVDDQNIADLCKQLIDLKSQTNKKAKAASDKIKADIILWGGHNKIRCGNVLISKTMTAAGKESYRLTVSGRGE
jgi:hypothetical protein